MNKNILYKKNLDGFKKCFDSNNPIRNIVRIFVSTFLFLERELLSYLFKIRQLLT